MDPAHSHHPHDPPVDDHQAAHVDHTGHEQMFRRRFWVCLVLSIPVLLYSPMLQDVVRLQHARFPGQRLDRRRSSPSSSSSTAACPSCRWPCPSCATASRA